MNENANAPATSHSRDPRNVFLRDAVVFHGKLMLDGLRDVILFPVALVAAIIDLIWRDDPAGHRFYDVVHFARQTEQWIDLFEAADRAPDTDRPRPHIEGPGLDQFIDDIETKLKAGHEKGELSASAKKAVEQMLEAAKKAMDGKAGRN
ncbi:MAG TPA: hypothetical protein VKQ06_04955 [Gammaproteobacteria bacterium]|nr:hypothetical protein [Gammaproteobacteria bacterium]